MVVSGTDLPPLQAADPAPVHRTFGFSDICGFTAFLEGEGYPSDVVTEELVTPLDWQAQGMAAGTPFALAHTFPQTGPFRPANVAKDLPGLFFAGSHTVPGVGVPMVLISGKLAAERVGDYLPKPR